MERQTQGSPLPQVVCIGSAALDLLLEVDALPPEDGRVAAVDGLLAGGGPAATAAVTLARLGVATQLIASVGADTAGDLITAQLREEGVGLVWTHQRGGSHSGLSAGVIRRSPTATRSLVALAAGGSLVPLPDGAVAACRDARWIHVDHAGWPVVPWLRAQGVSTAVSVDGGNPIPGLDLGLVDLYVPSMTELRRWTRADGDDAALGAARRAGARAIVATRGAAGAVYRGVCDPGRPWPDGVREVGLGRSQAVSAPSQASDDRSRASADWSLAVGAWTMDAPRSTLGAGDVYHGALLAALVGGRPVRDAMVAAAVAAALSCRALDGRSAIPDIEGLAMALVHRRPHVTPPRRIDA